MVNFITTALNLLGLLSLIGGTVKALDTWPDAYTSGLIADASKTIAVYWLAAGIISWILFWGFALVISELALVRQALKEGPAKELREQTKLLKRIEALALVDVQAPIELSEEDPIE